MRHGKHSGPAGGVITRVAETVARRRLATPRDRVLVALSAGPDSTALAAAMAALRDSGRVLEVRALHVDHGLRPGGEADAACARATCERLGIPFETVRVRVGAGNVQAEARRARYRALRAAAARHGATRIATGHTRSDQAETFLLRALRGAGARGLSSIPPRRGAVVRPLIDVGRAEIVAWLVAQGLPWREDPTNASPRYARNALRLELSPVLRRLEPAFERALARAADLLRDDERALERRARPLLAPGDAVDLALLREEPRAVRRRVVRLLWRAAAPGERALPVGRVDAILALCRRGRPGALSLPGRRTARAAYGRLTIEPPGAGAPAREAPVDVPGPGRFRLGDRWIEVRVEGEAAPPSFPLVLRRRLPGDRIRPERGAGGKKLKALLIDRKVPRRIRDALVVLADGEGNVLAVPELGIRGAGAGSLVVTVRHAPEA